MQDLTKLIDISEKVKKAMEEGRPIIVLESTIISHGMPYPKNAETAILCEETARKFGVEPATIAIIAGRLKVGLTEAEIDYFGKKGEKIIKASRRDIPYLVATKQDGATTVAATMIIAKLAGIKIFATGGIGGVHRGAETTMDISADLDELSKTNVSVVCAGAKSILDLGLTLEYLETKGVPVIGYKTKELPAFFTTKSGFEVDYRIDTPDEIASLINAQTQLGYEGGMVIVNPIPEEYAMDHEVIDKIIAEAIEEAKNKGIQGKATTPFLLAKICELSGGNSLASNIQLVLNNVKLASQIACKL